MLDKNILFRQILLKTKDKLIQNWAPIISMLRNYEKISDNYKLYYKTNKNIFDSLKVIQENIKDWKRIETITLVKNENLDENILEFIIMSIIIENCSYFANNNHAILNIAEYITWIWIIPDSNHKRILISDLRNLYLKKENEQDIYIVKLFNLINKRNYSKLHNIVIIDDSLKELINENSYIKTLFQNTIILK